jgi:hypothetical protein
MIGNGAKQNPDTHQKKGWVRPRTADHRKREREKSGGEKGRKRKNEGETEVVEGSNHQ